MKKIITLFILSLTISNSLLSQTLPIGYVYTTYNDPARSRDVTCWIYYPGVAAGQNQTVATGQFPVIVFGHGFGYSCVHYAHHHGRHHGRRFSPPGFGRTVGHRRTNCLGLDINDSHVGADCQPPLSTG